MEKAMFGAGCFWGVEHSFSQVPGIISTAVGFSGGHFKNPSYKDVCTKSTDHAEVVLVEFDLDSISYEQLLTVFFSIHDPTTPNRQGPDVGYQYRSAIYYFSDAQKKSAEKIKAKLDKSDTFKDPIVTEITAAGPFYKAEEYHQQYYQKKGIKGCGF